MSTISTVDKSSIINQKHLINGQPRWTQVKSPQIYKYPYNCIGWIVIRSAQIKSAVNGSGFLISPSFVLTSAHTFLIVNQNQAALPHPSQILFMMMQKEQTEPTNMKIRSIKVSPQAIRISNQLSVLRESRGKETDKTRKNEIQNRIKALHRQEMKHDYALLQLEQDVKIDRYFEMYQDIESFPQLTVSGYVKDQHTGQFRHWTHFDKLAQTQYGSAFYDIDTMKGQSGAPLYFKDGDKITLIGIHKGFSMEYNLNHCLMITREVVQTLQQWVQDMKGSLNQFNLKKRLVSEIEELTLIKERDELNQQLVNKEKLIQEFRQERVIQQRKIKQINEENENLKRKNQLLLTDKQTLIKQLQGKTQSLEQIIQNYRKLKIQNFHLTSENNQLKEIYMRNDPLRKRKIIKEEKPRLGNLEFLNYTQQASHSPVQTILPKNTKEETTEKNKTKGTIPSLKNQKGNMKKKELSIPKKEQRIQKYFILQNKSPISVPQLENKILLPTQLQLIAKSLTQGVSMQFEGCKYDELAFQLAKIVNKKMITSLILKNTVIY